MSLKTFVSREASAVIAAIAAGDPVCQLLPLQAVGGMSVGLTRLRFDLTTAVATQLGLIAAATTGTPVTSVNGVPVSGLTPSNGSQRTTSPAPGIPLGAALVTAWGPAPTFAVTPVYLRQAQAAGAVGNFIEWTWPEDDPLVLDPQMVQQSGTFGFLMGIAVRNIGVGATAAMLVSARWKEFR